MPTRRGSAERKHSDKYPHSKNPYKLSFGKFHLWGHIFRYVIEKAAISKLIDKSNN